MSEISESNLINDIKIYSISRIFLDNFKHIKAYWPMIGKKASQTLLSFGVDDIDGTIDDTTKIYSMAGAEEQNPTMSTEGDNNINKTNWTKYRLKEIQFIT